MGDPTERAEQDRAVLREASGRGPIATLRAYLKLSGPGWLQSAITLGGGSLAGSLYLGVLAGFSMLWLQPLAMMLGIVMLSAIAYVALTTGEQPFRAINRHVNPVLGWGWAVATLAANMVWALPQYALATSVLQQNLAPGVFEGSSGKLVICIAILAVTIVVTWSYGSGSRGIKLYERILKLMVAAIVLCFVGVVIRLAFTETGLDGAAILAGFVPDLSQFNHPATSFGPHLAAIDEAHRGFWTTQIVAMQRDVMITAAATAVGINMTFLLPYTLLAKGWDRGFRGLARFDLATGMLLPFLLATSCVVIAAANQFHTQPVPGLVEPAAEQPAAGLVEDYEGLLARASVETGVETAELPVEERRLAAMLVKRDAFDLAKSLRPLTGDVFANLLFGLGVLGMALSTITLLMLISGFVICEMLGQPQGGRAHKLGTLAATSGVLGPFIWSEAAFYLAVPTSVVGMALLPIAYWTFFLMMNSKSLLGDNRPRGGSRWAWNLAMLPAAGLATVASAVSVWDKSTAWGLGGKVLLGGLSAFLVAAVVVQIRRR